MEQNTIMVDSNNIKSQYQVIRFRIQKVISVLMLFLLCTPLFSSQATQRIYTARDKEYKSVMLLCQTAGVVYPAVTPVSATELIKALQRIPENISPTITERKETLINELQGNDALYNSDSLNFDINIYGGANGLLHGNIDAYEYFVPYRNLDPMIAASLNASFANTVDLYFEFMEKDEMMAPIERMDHWTNFYTIISIDNGKLGLFKHLSQAYQPFKVGLSTGNDWFNFQIGRNRQSYGHGVTGNLFISDNFSYEEYMRITFSTELFSYYLDITHFDQQIDSTSFAPFRLSGNHQIRAVHRFEFTPIENLVFAANIGSMFQSDSMFDWRMLIPLMIPHNFNNFSESGFITPGDEANNMMGIDISWSFLPSWMLHFEAVMDQFQLSYEKGNFMPNAFGFLLNVQNTSIINDDFVHSYIEAVYTMPYLYLNRAKIGDNGRDYNYDWIVGHKITGGNEIAYSGYPEGPDTLKFSIGSTYMFDYGLNAGINIDFMMHGIHGIAFHKNAIDTVNEDWREEKNIMEYTLALGLSISYDINSNLAIGMDTYLPYKWNYRNVDGEQAFIPQAFIFVRYSFL